MVNKPDLHVLTRFGVGVTDPAWFEHRFRLFEAITLASMRAQTDCEFVWTIFIGKDPLPIVEPRLNALLAAFPAQVRIVRAAQSVDLAVPAASAVPRLIALVDDDDAWRVDTVARVKELAAGFVAKGTQRIGFTFDTGYEWILSDLLDVDALARTGRRVVRKASVRKYVRPFLTMSSFVLCPPGEVFLKAGVLHSSKGEALTEAGYARLVLTDPDPAWLYVRHHQADSAIQKAPGDAETGVSVESLARSFGINAALVHQLRELAPSTPYALKRTHQHADKSNLTLSLTELETRIVGYPPVTGHWHFSPSQSFGLADVPCRLVIHDDVAMRFCLLERIAENASLAVDLGALPSHGKCRYKVQVLADGKWRDRVSYRPVPLPSPQDTTQA